MLHHPPPGDDARDGGRKESPDVIPPGVLPKGDDGHDISGDEHGKDDAGGIASAKEKNEDNHMQKAHPGKTALREPDSKTGEDGQHPLGRGQVRHGAAETFSESGGQQAKVCPSSRGTIRAVQGSAPRDRVVTKG